MKKAYRIYHEKSKEIQLSFVATNDEEAIKKAKEMYNMEENSLERWNGMQNQNQWTKLI